MSFQNNNNSIKKNTFCKYGCQTAIKFDNSRVTAKGVKIPLNLDGTLHDCPNGPFNKTKQLHEIDGNNNTTRTITCKYCNQQITFNDNIISERGKKIPLNPDGSHHSCPQRPFNQARSGSKTEGREG
jgi:hypothetical protein